MRTYGKMLFAALLFPITSQAADSPHTLSSNVSLVSEYVSRGLKMSWGRPALQGGFDAVHASGFYAGTWASSIDANLIAGGITEIDLYGGYSGQLNDEVDYDLGVIYYAYPNANMNKVQLGCAGNQAGCLKSKKIDTAEIYAAFTWETFTAKYYYSMTDYFGWDGDTVPIIPWTSGIDGGVKAGKDTKGSGYLDLSYGFPLSDTLNLELHGGYQTVSNSKNIDYSDYKICLTKTYSSGWNTGIAYTTTQDADIYENFESLSGNGQKIDINGDTFIVSVGRAF